MLFIQYALTLIPIFCRNWSKQMGVSFRKLWTSWSIYYPIVWICYIFLFVHWLVYSVWVQPNFNQFEWFGSMDGYPFHYKPRAVGSVLCYVFPPQIITSASVLLINNLGWQKISLLLKLKQTSHMIYTPRNVWWTTVKLQFLWSQSTTTSKQALVNPTILIGI